LPPAEVVVEEIDDGESDLQVIPNDKSVDDDLLEKTELLTRLAEAAGALTAIGPDLSGSIYTEEEIRGKAKFLSEEFDRYLSIRNRFYNAHILIKGGDYLVGGAHLAKSELAEQIVTLQDFYISKFPVTNALFEIFVEQTGYITTAEKYGFSLVYFPRMQRSRDPISGVERFSLHNQAYSKKVSGACWHQPFGPGSSLHLKRTHPVVQVSVTDARAFAAWTGKRLPTEIEWEAAARTARGYLYPWGNQWQEDACNIEQSLHGDTAPVDQYVKFANSAEVADTLGNVLEWTGDFIGDIETADTYIAKGASWISHGEISLTDRHYIEMNVSSNILGFRCVAI
jgi:formylglycine-generating enzyme required for sulfatase activity